MAALKPSDFIITRKRKKYRFALFANSPLCFEASDLLLSTSSQAHSLTTMFAHYPGNESLRKSRQQKTSILELGAGTGLFSVNLASKNPKKMFLPCDVKADRLQKGARLAEEKQLTNINFLRAHANQLEEVLAPASLKEIWLTFPDPYSKKRQAKHRLTHLKFLALYQKLLDSSGRLYFKTDNHSLFDWSLEQLVVAGWRLEELSYDLHNSNLKEEYKTTTTYEEKFMAEGLAICFVSARPPSASVASRQPNRRP